MVDQQVARLLQGRLFVDVVKSGKRVSCASSSPGLVWAGEVELAGRAVRFVKPVEATAEITQAFLSSVLGSANPLLDASVAVGVWRWRCGLGTTFRWGRARAVRWPLT